MVALSLLAISVKAKRHGDAAMFLVHTFGYKVVSRTLGHTVLRKGSEGSSPLLIVWEDKLNYEPLFLEESGHIGVLLAKNRLVSKQGPFEIKGLGKYFAYECPGGLFIYLFEE